MNRFLRLATLVAAALSVCACVEVSEQPLETAAAPAPAPAPSESDATAPDEVKLRPGTELVTVFYRHSMLKALTYEPASKKCYVENLESSLKRVTQVIPDCKLAFELNQVRR